MTTLYDVVVKNRHVEGGNIAVMGLNLQLLLHYQG